MFTGGHHKPNKLLPGGLQACGPVVDVLDVEMTKNEHIYDQSAVVTLLTPQGGVIQCSFRFNYVIQCSLIQWVKPRREGKFLTPSLPPGVDSSDAKMSKKEHCMTPKPGSKVTPQLGSYICSFLVNYTSETSTTGLAATVAASLEATWRRFFWLMVAPWVW